MRAPKYRRSLTSRLFTASFRVINWLVSWHRLPTLLGALNLLAFRDLLREKNLYDTSTPSTDGQSLAPLSPCVFYTRTDDGTYNDLDH